MNRFTNSLAFLARDAFMKRIVTLLPWCSPVRLSVCLSVCLGQVCIVIIRCTLASFGAVAAFCDSDAVYRCHDLLTYLARISVYGWIVQCSGHSDTKACPSTPNPNRLSPVPPARKVGYGCANWAYTTITHIDK